MKKKKEAVFPLPSPPSPSLPFSSMEEKTSHKTKKEKGGKSTRTKLKRQKTSTVLDASVNEIDQLHSEDYSVPRKLEHDTENVSSVKAKKSALSKSKKRKIGMVSNAGGDTEMSKIKRSVKGKKVKKKLKKDVDNKTEINKDDGVYQISSGGEDSPKGMMNTDNVSSGKAKKSALSKTKKWTIGMVSNARSDTERSEIKSSGKGKKVKKLKKGVDNKIEINEDDGVYQISLGDEDSSKGMMNTENVSSGKAKKPALSKTKKQTIGMVINAGGDAKISEMKRSGKGIKVKKKLKKDVDNKGEINEDDDVCQISSGDEDSSKGMMKWLSEYRQCRPGVQILQQRIDDYIMAYDEKEEQERKKREAEAAEGGWTVVVHHKGRKKTTDEESGVTVGAVSQASVIDKMEKKKDKIASDFYNFQKREAKRNELLMLKNKFEEDKKRIQQLRAARKFRPY